jgi:Domain of unknown function (DUF4350)
LPIPLSKGDRKLLLIGGSIFVLMVIAAFIFAKGPDTSIESPTTYSTASGGAKAAYLLLKASGYNVERWERPPADLPNPAGKTLILIEPEGGPTRQERQKVYRFIESGGRVIATGSFAPFFLPESGSESIPLGGLAWKKLDAKSPSPITRAAPQITMAPGTYWKSSSFYIPLYGDDKNAMVVKYKYGKGEVLWWGSPTPLTNAGLKEPGNLEFFLACVGEPHGTSILWDEYFHGYRRTLSASIEASPVKWMFVQLALFALIILLTYSRRSGPICPPSKEVRLSPLEFVRTLGALYERAEAAPVAVDIYYRRFRYWLTRRLGIASDTSAGDLERAIRERWNVKEPELQATLQACESAPYTTGMRASEALKLVDTLYDYAVKFKSFSSAKEKH